MLPQDIRNEIIRNNIPKLIRALTLYEDNNENVNRCENFAWSIIRNHRYMSINSHEIRRKIDAIKEKFNVDNFFKYAEAFSKLCDEVINDPLCIDHYEVDVQWSLIDLIITLAYNPTRALRSSTNKIDLTELIKNEKNEEPKINISYNQDHSNDDVVFIEEAIDENSELSDWSDTTPSLKSVTNNDIDDSAIDPQYQPKVQFSNIEPPQRDSPFKNFKNESFKIQIMNKMQDSWWLCTQNLSRSQSNNTKIQTNFAIFYNLFLNKLSNNLIAFNLPSIASEQNFLRELIWMFHKPITCKFFSIDANNIKLLDNITIPSVTENGFQDIIQPFLRYLRIINNLQNFLNSIYCSTDYIPSKTIECYAANLKSLLNQFWDSLLKFEKRLIVQEDFQINSIITFSHELREPFKIINALYDLHQQVILNLNKNPSHILSMHLLTSLIRCYQSSTNLMEANLAMALFLTTVKVFCAIIDTWWTEGRLEDFHSEFIVKRDSDQKISTRQYCKDKKQSFFIRSSISAGITENSFFKILLKHSLEAGYTLNLLYEINKIGDLRNEFDAIDGKLYNVFLQNVLNKIESFKNESEKNENNEESNCIFNGKENKGTNVSSTNRNSNIITATDPLLFFIFNSNLVEQNNIHKYCNGRDIDINDMNALHIFSQLQNIKQELPLEDIIIHTLIELLNMRIAYANSFVIRVYRDEYAILRNMQNIRKIMLLESSDLMYNFYNKLFQQIEDGDSWANSLALTMQLDDIICAKFPDMSSLFRVDITSTYRCQTQKVIEAVEELIISYNLSSELSQIITSQHINEYNKIFRFLLKVKWGIMTLENLRFPRSYRRQLPYAHFNFNDLMMRRLEQLRFWMIYAMQSIHFHLMTHVLQSMGEQLDEKIEKCTNLKELNTVHESYLETVCEHCFLVENFRDIKIGIEQMLNLILILRLEWNCSVKVIEESNPLSLDITEWSSDDEIPTEVSSTQVDAIELTYIRCHQYLANSLNNEVYLKQKTFLSGLSAAFNTSLPY